MVGLINQTRPIDESGFIYSWIQQALNQSLGANVVNKKTNSLLSWNLDANIGRQVNRCRNHTTSQSGNCDEGTMLPEMFKETQARDREIISIIW